jgi:hypothetical protein
MESKALRLHPEAEQEYLAALAWYRGRSPLAAEEFAIAVREGIEKIRQAPQRWPFYFENFRTGPRLQVTDVPLLKKRQMTFALSGEIPTLFAKNAKKDGPPGAK